MRERENSHMVRVCVCVFRLLEDKKSCRKRERGVGDGDGEGEKW